MQYWCLIKGAGYRNIPIRGGDIADQYRRNEGWTFLVTYPPSQTKKRSFFMKNGNSGKHAQHGREITIRFFWFTTET
jgi:hypothetical protein